MNYKVNKLDKNTAEIKLIKFNKSAIEVIKKTAKFKKWDSASKTWRVDLASVDAIETKLDAVYRNKKSFDSKSKNNKRRKYKSKTKNTRRTIPEKIAMFFSNIFKPFFYFIAYILETAASSIRGMSLGGLSLLALILFLVVGYNTTDFFEKTDAACACSSDSVMVAYNDVKL